MSESPFGTVEIPLNILGNPKSAARATRVNAWNVDGKVRLPVDPATIAERLGIRVSYGPLPADTAGFILKEPGQQAEIVINETDSKVRRRFTLAHELGHYVQNIDKDEVGYVDRRDEMASSGTDPAEIWSNRFAAELLMPAGLVNKFWARGDTPDEMRERFGVSSAALAFRLKNLGLLR